MAEGSREHDHDGGLAVDLANLLTRRRALGLLGGLGLVTVAAACGSGSSTSSTGSSGSRSTATTLGSSNDASCAEIPEETGGPYPGDGSNGPDVLSQSGVVRQDIRSSFGSSSGVAEGVPLQLAFTVVDTGNGCAPLAGAAVYVWHCDREGRYSMYSQGAEDENYLRGVQVADDDGALSFTTIFPACYPGRWPHVHFEVYPSVDDATSASNKLRTTQLAFPEEACDAVYATDGYGASVSALARVSLDADMVFSDGVSLQTPTMSGDAPSGYTATLTVPV
jgi:protocatechuate 3,4-dioxygenase beta subunit